MKNRNRILAVLLAGFMSVTTAFGSSTVAFATDVSDDAVTLEVSEESPEEAEVVAPEETEEASEETEETTEDIVVQDQEEEIEEASAFEEDEVAITDIKTVIEKNDKDTEFTVKGVVNYVNGKNVYVQDDTAAICAYLSTADKDLKAGNLITVKGSFKDYNGLAELDAAEIVNKDTANTKTYGPVEFDAITLADLVDNHDNYESQKVLVKGVSLSIVNTGTEEKPNLNYYVVSGEKKMLVYKAANTFKGMEDGDTVNVTAIVGEYSKPADNPKLGQLIPISAEKVTNETAEVEVTPEEGEIKAGTELEMSCETTGAVIYYSINGAEDFTAYDEAKKPVITAEDFVKASETDEVAKATVVVYAKAEDKDASAKKTLVYTQARVKEIKSSPKAGAVRMGAKVTLATATEGAKIFFSLDNGETYTEYTEPFAITSLPMTVMAKATCEGYLDSDVVTFEFTEREDKEYNIYFGQLHSHTNYSDGAGTCDEAFNHAANEVENLDFLAVTDHSNSFDNDTSATIKDGSASSEWVEGHELADKYTSDDFVALYGYEMTWSGGAPGHMNTFNTDGFMSRNMKGYESKSRTALQNYYADLVNTPDSISMFNHPGTTFGDFYDFAYYTKENDKQITLIEVGNGEGAIGSAGYFPSYEYYTRALDKGWHVAPANNQDNHKGRWGDANTGRSVILADSLTREDVYDAIRNMRVYATEDNDLNIYYTLNGEVMGTVLETKPEAVKIDVKTSDATDSGVMNVEVVVDGGRTAASQTVQESADEVVFELDPDFAYYYIRVTQADGNIAVTAPVWISAVEALGVSSISTDTSLPVAGEDLKINTAFYNNEESDFQVDSIVYTVNDEVYLARTGASLPEEISVLGSHSEVSDTFVLKNDKPGKVTVGVSLIGKLNGVAKTYTDTLTLIYVAEDMVTHVVVDGTHLNDYVTGYYGGNVGNFADIAASDFVKVDVVTDQITAETLEDAPIFVISAPNKNTRNGAVMHFEDSFIQLVKEYVAAGGNLIVCGLADYQDTADGQSSTEINKLLEAIGATTRLNSDEVCDDEKNGGQNYRLYPTNFNRDCYLVKDVSETQKYSAYSGCSILLDETAVQAGKAEAVVTGFESTYTIDSKKFDENYHEVPKGSVVFAAREELTTGSEILVTGTVFLSNFEVKTDLDYGGDEYYANRNILLNYLSNNKKDLKVSTIAEMRKGNLGDIFTVEGYVTAGTANEGNKFFDTIYVQDDTAGTTIFPVADEGIQVGTKLRLTGFVDEYQGDKELQIFNYKVIDGDTFEYKPRLISCQEAMDYETVGGSLLKVEGTITKVVTNSSGVDYFYVQDHKGNKIFENEDLGARVFIDGYILASDGNDTTADDIYVGNYVSAVGLCYMNPDGACLRVRDRAEIVSKITVTGVKDVEYTGKNITFDGIRVFVDRYELDPSEFKITYSNNKNAYAGKGDEFIALALDKAPAVNVTLKGGYTGNYVKYFNIEPADITAEDLEPIVKAATGKAQKDVPEVTWIDGDGKTVKLANNTDFTVSYPDTAEGAYAEAGDWNIVVTGKGNFKGTRTYALKLLDETQIPMSQVTIKGVADKKYTGEEIAQEQLKVFDGTTELTADDYEVSYANNIAVGTASVTVTGKGKYVGTKTATFKILGTSMADVKVEGLVQTVPFDSYGAMQDKLVVKLGDTVLTLGKDYELEYSNNFEVGKATVTVVGIGGYYGSKKLTYKIVKADVSKLDDLQIVVSQDVPFAKAGAKPEITITRGGNALTEGIDYKVTYKNNKKLYSDSTFATKNAPVATIKFIGGYKGKAVKKNFTIVPKAISSPDITVVAPDVAANSKKGGFKTKLKVYDGAALLKASDYEATYTLLGKRDEVTGIQTWFDPADQKLLDVKKDKAAAYDVIRVDITAKKGSGYYLEEVGAQTQAVYCVMPASKMISKATIKVGAKEYAGKNQAVFLNPEDITATIKVKEGKKTVTKTLEFGKDFDIDYDSYVSNNKLGTAKVTIIGMGEYGGSKVVKFKIGKKGIFTGIIKIISR
ncbi:CehA/McbA family metallohydrolase [Butyrivibrio sp. MC2021]|uniref:CehA/McbA family metallohydrolase n=1 Tax=Butyrivibrio sp. MC2021 TaxID=1408306 RepID=UPI0006872A22|nr:CehA/McbA family metallohydrolase [Butyrivibrio sp. MC2021]